MDVTTLLKIVFPYHPLRSLDFLGNLAEVMENIKNMTNFQVAGDSLGDGHEGGLDLEVRVLFSCLFSSLCHMSSGFPKDVEILSLFNCPVATCHRL